MDHEKKGKKKTKTERRSYKLTVDATKHYTSVMDA